MPLRDKGWKIMRRLRCGRGRVEIYDRLGRKMSGRRVGERDKKRGKEHRLAWKR